MLSVTLRNDDCFDLLACFRAEPSSSFFDGVRMTDAVEIDACLLPTSHLAYRYTPCQAYRVNTEGHARRLRAIPSTNVEGCCARIHAAVSC